MKWSLNVCAISFGSVMHFLPSMILFIFVAFGILCLVLLIMSHVAFDLFVDLYIYIYIIIIVL